MNDPFIRPTLEAPKDPAVETLKHHIEQANTHREREMRDHSMYVQQAKDSRDQLTLIDARIKSLQDALVKLVGLKS